MDDVTQLPDGEHREYYEDQTLKSVYTVKDGKIEGEYKEYDPRYSKEPVFVAQYENGELNGPFVKCELGYTQKGTYVHGKLHGVCEKTRGTTDREVSVYDNGVLQSSTEYKNNWVTEKKYENGNLVHELVSFDGKTTVDVEYKDGKPFNGFSDSSRFVGINWDERKIKFQVKDGKYQGEYIDTLNEKGIVAHYEDGVLHGQYRDNSGSELKTGSYCDGKFAGIVEKDNGYTVEYYRDGELDCTEFYERMSNVNSGKHLVARMRENGECKELGENGTIIRYQQKNGVKDGTYEVLDSDGRWVRESGTYKNGKLNGVYREFNSDGTVAARRFYKDGEDITPQQEVLRAAAAKNVNKENKEGKVNPKQSKIKKAQVALEMKMAGVKNKLMG